MSSQRAQPAVQTEPERAAPVRAGVVGLGYWGPNLARNLAALPGCELAWLCDPRAGAAAGPSRSFPGARVTGDVEAPVIVMEKGAVLDGHCRMTKAKPAEAPHGVVVPIKG